MENASFFNKNLFERILTSLMLAPIIIGIVYYGNILFTIMIVIVVILMAFEWYKMTSNNQSNYFFLWQILGILYITLPCASLIWLREQAKGREIVFWLLSVVWATDIAAYFVGNLIGGWKIYPKISPNKTWSGLAGGICAAALVGVVTANVAHSSNPKYLIGISIILGVYAQIGDMVESWIKRKFGVKDSGKVLPGHGGIMDRVDGIVPVAPKVVMLVLFDHWGIF